MDSNSYTTTPERKDIIEALWRLQKIILDTLDFNQVVHRIVDGLLTELGYLNLGYRIIVLTLVNTEQNILQRISLSSTPEATRAQEVSAIPFHNIEIPLTAEDNILIKVLREKKPRVTRYWPDLFRPVLTDEQALKNQEAAGIKTSMVYPVVVRENTIGVLIFSMVKEESEVLEEEKELIRGFTDIVGLAVENSRLYSSLENTTVKLKEANDKLRELDKLKDEFVSLASHELRTPMTVIKSYVWALLNNNMGQLNENQKDYLKKTYSSTERLITLVNDMLNISRIESGRLTIEAVPTDMGRLISEVVDELNTRAREMGVNLVFDPLKESLIANADPQRIKEVVINLIGNSLKFTPPGGSVFVSASIDEKGFITTEVKDTGRGINKDDMEKLFQKFNMVGNSHLTKEKGQGTGLGLYLSKSLVELHGGKIWASSPGEGRGATFSFTLPAARNAAGITVSPEGDFRTDTNLPLEPNRQA